MSTAGVFKGKNCRVTSAGGERYGSVPDCLTFRGIFIKSYFRHEILVYQLFSLADCRREHFVVSVTLSISCR